MSHSQHGFRHTRETPVNKDYTPRHALVRPVGVFRRMAMAVLLPLALLT